MDFSYVFLFDSSSGTHNNTEITNGVLKLQSGEVTGDWQSASRSVTSISSAYLLAVGQSLTGATFYVSRDNGITYIPISNKGYVDLSSYSGTDLKVKVSISDTNTQVDSLSVMYK